MTSLQDPPATPASPDQDDLIEMTRPQGVDISPGTFLEKARAMASTLGEIGRFTMSTLRAMPGLRSCGSEVFRQTSILVLSSGLIIWLMMFVVGSMCGVEANYTLKQVGAPLYSGVFSAYCGLREMAPYMWGYILAAKVGCGLVAEIGSMRISEEVDAMEVMGVDSMTYLIGSRVAAAWIAMPFMFIVGLGLLDLSEYLVVVVQLGGVSPGAYSFIFWLYQNPLDLLFSLAKAMAMGTTIVFVGCFYGYTTRGGPVNVGKNTAKSMVLNMVLIHVVGLLGTQLFWGLSPNAPIAN
jgi:phospholipid/cholesterol/gamma-HCH transport system permease protein